MKRKGRIGVEVDNMPSPNQIGTSDTHEAHLSVTRESKEFAPDTTLYYNITDEYEMTTNECYNTTSPDNLHEYLNVRIYENCNF